MKGGKRDMKTAKLGAIFLISVLAIAGVGAGYAAWTDTIYIDGKVNTGSVGWKFVDYSGTWVWKNLDNDACVILHRDDIAPGLNSILVAYAQAKPGIDDHHAVVTYHNIFPSINFMADVVIEYTGSVPGKLNNVGFYDLQNQPGNSWPEDIIDGYPNDPEELIDYYTTLSFTIYDADGNVIEEGVPYLGIQLHQGYRIHIIMTIHLDQLPELMNLEGDFGVFAEIVQWNEWPYDPDA
jgi:hypothetical protein